MLADRRGAVPIASSIGTGPKSPRYTGDVEANKS